MHLPGGDIDEQMHKGMNANPVERTQRLQIEIVDSLQIHFVYFASRIRSPCAHLIE
jgi:hypothetical protein